jgi:hypothetical protein
MAKVTINNVDYDTDSFTDEAKAQLLSLQFCEIELQNLQAEAAAIQTARIAYGNALKAELEKPNSASVDHKANDSRSSEPENGSTMKKGVLGGLFGKK